MTASNTPAAIMTGPAHASGQQAQNVMAMTKMLNACRLGSELPRVSFGMTGAASNTSYGRGALMTLRSTVTSTNEMPGTSAARSSMPAAPVAPVAAAYPSHASRHGYATYTASVMILFASDTPRASTGCARKASVIDM